MHAMDISVCFPVIFALLFSFGGDGPDVATAQSFSECTTPNKEAGSCIPLQQCTPIYKQFESNSLSDTDRVFFSQSQCGYRKDVGVLFCCAKRYLDSKPDTVTSEPRFGGAVKPGNWLPKEPDCPIDFGDRIVGGTATALDEYPWMALVEYLKPDNTKIHQCGGALINNRYVLTAAHCVNKITRGWRVVAVRLGEWDRSTNPDCEKGLCAPPFVDIDVEEAVVHPQYSPSVKDQYHDIALLRLAQPVVFTQYINAICLPDTPSLRSTTFTSYSMDVCGWGVIENGTASNLKLKAALTIVDFATCRGTYGRQGFRLETAQMCAGGKKGVDSCSGDSGGPLIYSHVSEFAAYFYVAGVVSFGPSACGLQGWPGIYTRVGPYVNWIKSTVKP